MFSLGEKMEFLIGNPFSTPVGQRIGKQLLFETAQSCVQVGSVCFHLYIFHIFRFAFETPLTRDNADKPVYFRISYFILFINQLQICQEK